MLARQLCSACRLGSRLQLCPRTFELAHLWSPEPVLVPAYHTHRRSQATAGATARNEFLQVHCTPDVPHFTCKMTLLDSRKLPSPAAALAQAAAALLRARQAPGQQLHRRHLPAQHRGNAPCAQVLVPALSCLLRQACWPNPDRAHASLQGAAPARGRCAGGVRRPGAHCGRGAARHHCREQGLCGADA